MSRITTPFDQFMRSLMTWLDSVWYVWVAVAITTAFIVVLVIIVKVRARARARVPQYRRQLSPD